MSMLIEVSYAKLHPSLQRIDVTTLTAMIEAASNWIERYCNRSFSVVSIVETFSGHDREELYLTYCPIVELQSVKFRGVDNSFEAQDLTSFLVDSRRGVIYSSSRSFPLGAVSIQVEYDHGFEETPAVVKEACAILCNYLFSNVSNTETSGLSSESLGSYSWSAKSIENIGIPKAVIYLIGSYRSIPVA